MNNYRQNIEHELAGMIAALGLVVIVGGGLFWALVQIIKWYLE